MMARQSAGDAKIAELRTALKAEVAAHTEEVARLERLIADERQAMLTKRELLERLGGGLPI